MSSITADTLKRLAALELAPAAMQEVLSIIASCIEPLEQRRRRDRDRKRAEFPRNIQGKSLETPAEIPPLPILPPQEERSKAKKPSRSTSTFEIPDQPTEEAIAFARGKGWDQAKIDTEWQRFRDHSLAKGKRHRNVLAAWRNWVTSPFQANGASNGQRSHHASRQSGADDFLSGLATVAANIGGDGAVARPAEPDIPAGRVNIEH